MWLRPFLFGLLAAAGAAAVCYVGLMVAIPSFAGKRATGHNAGADIVATVAIAATFLWIPASVLGLISFVVVFSRLRGDSWSGTAITFACVAGLAIILARPVTALIYGFMGVKTIVGERELALLSPGAVKRFIVACR